MSNPTSPWPFYGEDEIQAVTDVLKSGKVNYWTGNIGREFEIAFAKYANCSYAIALANGTLALELALYAIDLKPGDEVIVTPRTFLASASCVVMRGGIPVFADVDPVSQNITAETIEKMITPKTKAIIAVHLAGWPCEMDKIMTLAEKHKLWVIEDCAQAHGARYKNRPVGSWGHLAAFSFCQDKIMSTGGEGGMLTMNDKAMWEKCWAYKDHGKSYDTVYNREHAPGFRWLHESFGTNWRLTETQSAIGLKQLKKLDAWVDKRRQNAAMLTKAFKEIPFLDVHVPGDDVYHSYYKYYVFVNHKAILQGWTRDRIMKAINDQGIACFSGSCSEIYLEKCFENSGMPPQPRLPNAQRLGETSLMFLVHPTIEEDQMKAIVNTIQNVFTKVIETVN
ncbi:MAG: DegT/DnrJ/EryC1/StrS aminotransferase family protein [Pseudomonadota bacterium]